MVLRVAGKKWCLNSGSVIEINVLKKDSEIGNTYVLNA
jgi:hypothetical protein